MTTNNGYANLGDTIRFIAVFPDSTGAFQTGLSPTISVKLLTGVSLLVTGAAMTEDSNLPGVYYYEYTPPSAGIYISKAITGTLHAIPYMIIGDGLGAIEATSQNILSDTAKLDIAVSTRASAADVWTYGTRTLSSFGSLISDIWNYVSRTLTTFGFTVTTDTASRDASKADITNLATSAEISNLNNLSAQQVWEYVTRELTSAGAGGATAQEVWEYATRELTSAAGITETQFHDYLQSYPDSLDPADTPAIPLPPENTAVVLIYKYCRNKDDSILASATPSCQLLEYTTADGKAYYVNKEAMSFNPETGLASILVPPNAYIRVKIPEIDMDIIGYSGAGGTSLDADLLYTERQV